MPMKLRTKMQCSWYGYFGIGVGGGTYAFTVYANSLPAPFNTGVPVTTGAGATNGTGVAISNTFNGSGLLNQFYNSYKIRHSRLRVNIQPTVPADTGILAVCVASNTPPATSPSVIMEQPYALDKLVTIEGASIHNSILLDNPCHRTAGLSQRQYEDLPYIDTSTQPPGTSQQLFYVTYQTSNNTANAGIIPIRLDLEIDIEYNDFVPQAA